MWADTSRPKHRQIFEALEAGILSGRYGCGQALPSENALVRRWGVSRATAARALRDLEAAGLAERRRGAGTFVRSLDECGPRLGLLVPGLGQAEIFQPICEEIASAARARGVTLLWTYQQDGGGDLHLDAACEDLLGRGVSGVFLAPVELRPGKEQINERLVERLRRRGVPLVLLDADIAPFPSRSEFDLIGVDNRRVGYRQTAHALGAGCRRMDFVTLAGSATTVDTRIAGWGDALARGLGPAAGECRLHSATSIDASFVRTMLATGSADAYVCSNDVVAVQLVAQLGRAGVDVPRDVRVIGVDDVAQARQLPVPLTTIRQPCRAIGRAALHAMFQRLQDATAPARDILLDAPLVVRRSA